MYLLDTNVLSEPGRLRPDPRVLRWLAEVPDDTSFTAAVVLAEMLFGADSHADAGRRERLHANIDQLLLGRLHKRVLAYDERAARVHARLLVLTRQRMRSRPDLQIAAVALANKLTLVTRNVSDFEGLGVTLLNPWEPVT